MKLAFSLILTVAFIATSPTLADEVPSWATNKYLTYQWCEVDSENLCDFVLEGVYPRYDHVQWGTGNFSLNGWISGAFTPKIVKKHDDYQTTIGYVNSMDNLRDVFYCKGVDLGYTWDTQCDYKTIPGRLFRTVPLPGVRGSGITREKGSIMGTHVPNGACIPIYITSYQVLDTTVSPPRVKENVHMSARQARILHQCVLMYTEFY
ncbi:unnamed protein product [Agarophyton chilense]|eukprot:gb/GEZJ01007107.1/.p1 GENE.gb/GEZJ01007107.1/~~gb/GEZJ01007107.1/.p1  ORF type:complete len:206 (-),score=22.00 gb/GEZJ01007107.1/:131-748(-)